MDLWHLSNINVILTFQSISLLNFVFLFLALILLHLWNQIMTCPYLRFHTKIYSKVGIYINELILSSFSPFDITCKKRNIFMRKTSGNVFSGHQRGWVFHNFPRLPSIMSWGLPSMPLRIFLDHITIFNSYATSKMKVFIIKKINGWKVLLTVVTYVEFFIKCERAPRSESGMYQWI